MTSSDAVSGRFANRVALITGAASGIGRAVTLRLAAEGASVVAADVDASGLAGTAEGAVDAPGAVEAVALDVTDREACFAAVESCVDAHGRLDVLGNVAGVLAGGHMTEIDEFTYRRLMAVNVDGPFFMCQAAIPHLLETSGSIVNMASNAGVQGVPFIVPYSMTKGALVSMTQSLAMEYIKTPLRVNAIAPAGTDTQLATSFELPETVDLELAARMMGYRGVNEPEEVAALFAFVASDEATGIHGAVLRIDRGVTV